MKRVKASWVVLAAVVCVIAWSHVGSAQGTNGKNDPWWGTWKLNVAKSKYTGAPPPKSTTLTIEPLGNGGEKVTVEGVAGDGSRVAYSFTGDLDGKDAAYAPGSVGTPNGGDTIAVKHSGTYTFDVTYKKAGKVVGSNRVVYSKDGKRRTATGKGTSAGKPTSNVTVWDKQ